MKCPGQDMQYWTDNAIFEVDCPNCGATVEFYKDDTTRKCHSCEKRFVNPKMDFGCASYCQYAEQCLGTLPEDFMGSREDLIKDKVAVAVKRFYHTDFKSIKKATNVARYVENIGKSEGGNLGILLCAAYLHGLDNAEINNILTTVNAAPPLAEAILAILGGNENNDPEIELEELILTDALTLYGFQEETKAAESEQNVPTISSAQLHTDSGRQILQTIA